MHNTDRENSAFRPSKFDKHLEQIRRFIDQGYSMSHIARELGYTDVGIADYARRRGLIKGEADQKKDKILTIHPSGAPGVYIDKSKYKQVRKAILGLLKRKEEVLFSDLKDHVEKKLQDNFEGSVSWYLNLIKLDLEARGEIVRVSDKSPQRLALPMEN